jgi:hypothetical protein
VRGVDNKIVQRPMLNPIPVRVDVCYDSNRNWAPGLVPTAGTVVDDLNLAPVLQVRRPGDYLVALGRSKICATVARWNWPHRNIVAVGGGMPERNWLQAFQRSARL